MGLVCIEEIDKETAFKHALMSCRILGRHLGSWMIKQNRSLFTNGFSKLIAGLSIGPGNLLLLVYQPTVDSDIPPELLDDENQIFYVIPTTFKNLPFQKFMNKSETLSIIRKLMMEIFPLILYRKMSANFRLEV